MDAIFIQLVLWMCLIFFFWALKENLERVESDIDAGESSDSGKSDWRSKDSRYVRPEKVIDPIGSYQDAPIYRYAIIEGKRYQFDHVSPSVEQATLPEQQRCLAPGLIYMEC
jgi:hypothetical protein